MTKPSHTKNPQPLPPHNLSANLLPEALTQPKENTMRRISQIDNGFNQPTVEFVDHIANIVRRYLCNIEKVKPSVISHEDVVTSSAKELNWEVLGGSCTSILVLHVARISDFTTPLRREKDWNNDLVAAAVAEYQP